MKRIFAGILSILLMLFLRPQCALAAEPDWDAPLTIGGITINPDEDDTTSGWQDDHGWKYYTGKYLYLYNCDLSNTELIVNGRDLTIYAEGVNQIGMLSSDKKVSVFGNGIIVADRLNMFGDNLKLDSNSSPAFFLMKSGSVYELINSSGAPGKIYGTHTFPSGKTYDIPAGSELQICMSNGYGADLTIPSGARLQVSGKLSVAGETHTVTEFAESYGVGDTLRTKEVPVHARLKVNGAMTVFSGSAVKLSGTIDLNGSLRCSSTIDAGSGTVSGRVLVNGNCADSDVAISGGYVELAPDSSLGTLTSSGGTILCQTCPGSAFINNLSMPFGGTMDIHGYRLRSDKVMSRGMSSLHITGTLSGSGATYTFHDGLVYLSNAPASAVILASGYILQDTDTDKGSVTTAIGAQRFVRGTAQAAAATAVPAEVVTIGNTQSESGCAYTTQTSYHFYQFDSYNFEATYSDDVYAVSEDFCWNLVNDADDASFLNSMLVIVGFDSSGKLMAKSYPNTDRACFRSLIAVIADMNPYYHSGTGGSASSAVTTNTGGSTLGGSDQGNSSSSGTETTMNTGSTYSYRIVASAGDGGSISPSGSVYAEADSSKTFTITPATGWELDSLKVNGSSVPAASSYTFTSVNANSTIRATFKKQILQITKAVTGSGTISGDVSAEYGSGKTYTFTPAEGWEIKDIQINGKSVGAKTSYTISSITGNTTISATFQKKSYKITYAPATGGTVSGPASVAYGEKATYTAAPQEGWEVTDLTIGGKSYGAVSSASAVVNENTTVSATFKKKTYTVTLPTVTGATITGPTSVEYGSGATYKLTLKDGYQISSFLVNDTSGSNGSVTITVKGPVTITAEVVLKSYTITKKAGEGGKITGSTTVKHFSTPSYTIEPNEGYEIADVKVDGKSIGAVEKYQFTSIKAGHTIAAEFKKATYTVTASADSNGFIYPEGRSTAEVGGRLTYSIRADEGYLIHMVTVDGEEIGPVSEYSFEDISENHTISVTFISIAAPAADESPSEELEEPEEELADDFDSVLITVLCNEGGTVSPEGEVLLDLGENCELEITPDEGYVIADVLVDGKSVGAVAVYILEEVSENHTVEVVFAEEKAGHSALRVLPAALVLSAGAGTAAVVVLKKRRL